MNKYHHEDSHKTRIEIFNAHKACISHFGQILAYIKSSLFFWKKYLYTSESDFLKNYEPGLRPEQHYPS